VEETGTVIVGGGPAGLAVAACLSRAKLPYVVLEQDARLGQRWRSRYDRLHLHTAKQYSALPYLSFPAAHPRYPSRDQVVEYLETYARHFNIAPRFGERVTGIAHISGAWTVSTASAATYRAANVVICTGRSDVPHRASWPGLDGYTGRVLHSAEYTNGASFAGQRVLVVGFGNSGGEIALDLAESGARPDIAVRNPVNVVPRDLMGQPIQRSTILLRRMPVAIRDRIGRTISRMVFGDLGTLGLRRAAEGPVSAIVRRGRIPLIDVGTIAMIRAGKIGLRPDVQRVEADAVVFGDGSRERYDAVVLATGYDTGLKRLAADLATDAHGLPLARGLYLVGFGSPPTGALREIAIEAKRVVARIAKAPTA